MNFGIELSRPNGLIMLETSIDDIKDITKKWGNNRDPDLTRCKEIIELTEKNNDAYLEGDIYAWFHKGKLYIYDGLTRYTAGLMMNKNMNKNMKLHLRINFSTDENKILEHFRIINKSIPLPETYKDNDYITLKLVVGTIKLFCEEFSEYAKGTRKPNGPNFNRDSFTDDLTDLVKKNGLQTMSPNILFQILKETNDNINSKYPSLRDKYKSKKTLNNPLVWFTAPVEILNYEFIEVSKKYMNLL